MENILKAVSREDFLDKLGVLSSTFCAFHCMVCAFLPGLLLLFGLDIFLSSEYEWGFTILTAIVACLALWSGFERHRSKKIVLLFSIGISGLFVSRALETGAHAEPAHTADQVAETTSAHHHDHHEHQGIDLHLLGTIVGIGSGLLIAASHIQSIRKSRCCKSTCNVSH